MNGINCLQKAIHFPFSHDYLYNLVADASGEAKVRRLLAVNTAYEG